MTVKMGARTPVPRQEGAVAIHRVALWVDEADVLNAAE